MPASIRASWSCAAALVLVLAACATQPAASDVGDSPATSATTPVAGTQDGGDRAAIERLKVDARAIARTTGCGPAGQCASIGLGVRACGGPSEYVVYCPASTDTAALRRKVAEVERAERAFNEKYGLASTCEFRMPPTLEVSGGSCRAVAPNTVPPAP
jgi:hypothetical protein